MKVKEVMSKPAIVAGSDTTLEVVAKMMLDNNIGGLPVVDTDGKLVGVVTESDFSAKQHAIPFSRIYAPQLFGEWMSKEGIEHAYQAVRKITVDNIMTKQVATVKEDDNLALAVNKMLEFRVHRLPVVDDNNVPVGMISRHDLLKLVVDRL